MSVRLFCRTTALAVPVMAVLVLLAPGSMLSARAQAAQPAHQAALADNAEFDSGGVGGRNRAIAGNQVDG